VALLAILTFWAQSNVCVYWLPNEVGIPSAQWQTPNLIRFNDSRIIDWRSGRAWLDPRPKTVRFKLTPDSRYYVEVNALVDPEDFFTLNLTGKNPFQVTYRDARTSQVLQQFSLEIESSLQPIDSKRCYIVPSMNAISDHIDIVEFPESGPKTRRIKLPSPTEVLRRRGFRLLGEDRLLSWYYDEAMGSNVAPVWRMQLLRIEGDDVTLINDWQSSSIEYLYTDTNHITTVKPGNTTIEVRNREGEIERVLEKSWPWLVPAKSAAEPSTDFMDQGYIAWGSELTAPPKYWDAVTLQPLLADRPSEMIRHYDQPSGRIVSGEGYVLEVSWRDIDQPIQTIPLRSPLFGTSFDVTGSSLVTCQDDDVLQFSIVDLERGTVSDFDYRPRRSFWICTTALFACLACVGWCWVSRQQRWPVGWDWCVLASGVFLLHLYSAWILGETIAELESFHWSEVTMAGMLLSSWWLIFGYRSIAFRLAFHLALFATLSFGLHYLDLGMVDPTLLLFFGLAPILFLILGLALFRLRYPPDSNPPSNRTRILDLLFLTAALAAILARIRVLISPEQGGLSELSVIWSEMESIGLALWEFGLLTVMCLVLSLAVLMQWSSRRSWVSLVINVTLFSFVFAMTWYCMQLRELLPFMLLVEGTFAFLMVLFRIRGWRFVWRFQRSNARRPRS
jgi:hypothetical protein